MNWKTGIYLTDEVKSVVWKIVFYVFLGTGIVLSCIAFAQSNIYIFIFGTLPCSLFVGFLAVKVWLPRIGNFVGFGILFPRTFLKKAPLVLTPYWGMLTRCDYAGMLSGLQPLAAENPGHPDVVYLYAQACMHTPGKESEGFEVMEEYFRQTERETSVNYVKLLFYYADKAAEYQNTGFLESILQQELQTKYYTESEKKMIETRLVSMRRV
ncbi:MAG: hypothetical protein IJW23_00860 [Lentisphaeria bacterium]|nr:hypothetical protein [Lentisphaeria bacterium]